jgi:hypothetical protein
MNDTLIFLVLGALALIFKWLTSHASGTPRNRSPPRLAKGRPRASRLRARRNESAVSSKRSGRRQEHALRHRSARAG